MAAGLAYLLFLSRRPVQVHHMPVAAETGVQPTLNKAVTRVNQPILEAARLVYEAVEGTSLQELMCGRTQTPNEKLAHLVEDMIARALKFYGKNPPSMISKRIPPAVLEQLSPTEGKNELETPFFETGDTQYTDVEVDGYDLAEHLDALRKHIANPLSGSFSETGLIPLKVAAQTYYNLVRHTPLAELSRNSTTASRTLFNRRQILSFTMRQKYLAQFWVQRS